MRKFNSFSAAALVCALIGLATPHLAQAQVSTAAANPAHVTVAGTAPRLLLNKSVDTGRLSANQNLGRMVLLLAPTAAQDAAAQSLVAAQHDATSPYFHRWLTPEEFGTRFGVANSDALKVTAWLESQGLTVHEVAKSRRFIVFSGNVAQVERAFAVQMHSYTYQGASFQSNAGDIQIPSALQSLVKGVVRLHSDPSRPALKLGKKVPFQKKSGQFTFGDGSHYLTPADFAAIYNVTPLYTAGIDGTGQSIAIVGRSNIDVQNVRDFRNLLGLPANDPEVIVNGDDPGQNADAIEAMLDVTWSGAVAPGAHVKFVVSQSNFADGIDVSAEYIVDHNLAPVVSTSFGSCEATMGPVATAFYYALWQQAAAQGITSFVSAGDNGGAGCDAPGGGAYAFDGLAVNGIASTPYNVAVGGTQFNDTAAPDTYWSNSTDPVTGQSVLGYIPEMVWNESSNDPNNVSLYAGSGGASSLYAKPDWQLASGVPNDGARDLPDISLTAAGHDGYLFCFESDCSYGDYFFSAGGTSVSSPASAGIMALINQKLGGQPQGMANYVFYKLASTPGIFHDTTVGNNKVPDGDGQLTVGYDAAPGYDLATGLGSFDVNALATRWQAAGTGASSAITLALAPGQLAKAVHGTPISFDVKVTCTGTCAAPSGLVALNATSSTPVNLGTASAQLDSTGAATIQTASIPGGKYRVAARYGGDSKLNPSTSASIPVTVTPESSQTFVGSIGGQAFTQAPITVSYGLQWQIGIVVAGNSGQGFPSGTMTLTADGSPLTTSSYDAGTGTLNPDTLTLNYGEKSAILTGGPTSQSSTVSYVVPSQSLGVGTHHIVANYPGDASFAPSQGTYSYQVTPAASVIADFFPVGSPVAKVPVALAGQIAFVNYAYAPYSGTVSITDLTSGTPVVLGSAPLDPTYGGSYSIPVTVPAAGTYALRVDFSGDANVLPSYQTYTVPFTADSPSYIALTTDIANSLGGQAITLTANVSSDVRLHTATGAVTFFNGSTSIGTANLDANGNAVLVTTALPAGADSLTASYPGDIVLQPSVSSPAVASVADYILQTLPPALTIKDGQSAATTLNLVPIGGFAQPVTLACGSLPAHTTCTFATPTVTLDGLHPATVSLTIGTTSTVAGLVKNSPSWMISSSVALAGLLLFPFAKRRRFRNLLASLVLFAIAAAGIGCGGSSSNSNQAAVGTYQIQITATSAGITQKTATIAVTVTK